MKRDWCEETKLGTSNYSLADRSQPVPSTAHRRTLYRAVGGSSYKYI